ncbi:NTP transferase domain-containing protein [Sphingomonas sp. ID1715]|uniref:NTP transferase domain-containing protein n=1 Tax=Sphingomonas sp. ID1715 TaxID=1656898 RepID=UPI001487D371|nr:NTP transferase domain-containing protein [Sphingomonas sp. ID1715]NNM78263.1 NTP transferase domain-containing protein [Sphingomonas sp. ID1715]
MGFTAVVLSAQRDGKLDPLAAAHGVSHKGLIPICGRPLIDWVMDALTATPGLDRVRISLEEGAAELFRAHLGTRWAVPIDFVTSASNLADSVYRAAEGVDGPIVFTTADNINLTSGAVTAMLAPFAAGADVTVAVATKAAVLAAHPEGQRRFYEFSDDAYSNCNLYATGSAKALKAAETFREGGQFAKNPRRLITAFGLINVLMLRYRLVSLASAFRRISRRLKIRIEPVVLADGGHAIDVDNERTYRCAEVVLRRRLGDTAPAAAE